MTPNEIDKYSYMDSLRNKISKIKFHTEGYGFTDEYHKGYKKGLSEALKLAQNLVDTPVELSCDLKIIDDWIKDPKNQKVLLAMVLDGQEGEDTELYYVKLKGLDYLESNRYLHYVEDNKKFLVGGKVSIRRQTKFTKAWLKENWPEYDAYNDAGLLIFEKVNL